MGNEAGTEEMALVLEEFTRGFIMHTYKSLSGQYAQSSGTCVARSRCTGGDLGRRNVGAEIVRAWGFIRSDTARIKGGERTFQ